MKDIPVILSNHVNETNLRERMDEVVNPELAALRHFEEQKEGYHDPIQEHDLVEMNGYVNKLNDIKTIKNNVDEFISKTKNNTYGLHEYTREDVVSAKIKTFYTGSKYSILNMNLEPEDIIEFTLYIILTMVIYKIKKHELNKHRQNNLERLLTACEEFIRNRNLNYNIIFAYDRYLIFKQEIIFNYILSIL